MIKSLCKEIWDDFWSEHDDVLCDSRVIAAGDPKKMVCVKYDPPVLSHYDRETISDLQGFVVSGSSMSVCHINSEDYVYVRNNVNSRDLQKDDFVAFHVDDEYYRYCHQIKKCDHKLRRFIMNISAKQSVDEAMKELENYHTGIVLEKYRTMFLGKISKIREFYPNEDLCLSYTFRDGEFWYSFHPRKFLEGVVAYVYVRREQKLVEAPKMEAYL